MNQKSNLITTSNFTKQTWKNIAENKLLQRMIDWSLWLESANAAKNPECLDPCNNKRERERGVGVKEERKGWYVVHLGPHQCVCVCVCVWGGGGGGGLYFQKANPRLGNLRRGGRDGIGLAVMLCGSRREVWFPCIAPVSLMYPPAEHNQPACVNEPFSPYTQHGWITAQCAIWSHYYWIILRTFLPQPILIRVRILKNVWTWLTCGHLCN